MAEEEIGPVHLKTKSTSIYLDKIDTGCPLEALSIDQA